VELAGPRVMVVAAAGAKMRPTAEMEARAAPLETVATEDREAPEAP